MKNKIRKGEFSRKTNETNIKAYLNLDGSGQYDINTGIGFFDHMLNLMIKHGLMDMTLKTEGDLYIDSHHTVEDTGIVIGKCIKTALEDKSGIKRYGTCYLPMDEALAFVSMDISGRPYIVFDANFTSPKLGEFDTELTEEFFRALAFNSGITLHIKVLYGKNNHHMIEAIFKAFGRAFSEAISYNPRIEGVMSTKGEL